MPSGDDHHQQHQHQHQHESESLIQRRNHHHHRAEKVDDGADSMSDAEEECALLLKNGNSHSHSSNGNRTTPRNAPPKKAGEPSSRRAGGFCFKNLALLLLVVAVFLAGRHMAPLTDGGAAAAAAADRARGSAGSASTSTSTGTSMVRKRGDFTLPKRGDDAATAPTSSTSESNKKQQQTDGDDESGDSDSPSSKTNADDDDDDDSTDAARRDQFPTTVVYVPQNTDGASPFLGYHQQHLEPTKKDFDSSAGKPDYGDISYASVPRKKRGQDRATVSARSIDANDDQRYQEQRAELLRYMDQHDLRSREKYDPYDDLDFPRECTRPQWTWRKRPSCLSVHDLSYDRVAGGARPSGGDRHSRDDDAAVLLDPHQFHHIHYLAHGAFRDSFLFEPADGVGTPFVTKTKIFERDLDHRDLYKIGAEAVIMEALSPSNVTSNIYAYCGSTIIVERGREVEWDIIPYRKHYHHGRMKQSELDALQKDDVHPMNQQYLSVEDKLDIAIAMAESLAEMHGYEGGVITNDDISLSQWLYADDGRVILNDMNDAMFMDWNYEKQEYCKYWRSFGGTYKAPEEYDGDWLDETVDIWPMGNILFSLLTGLYPYYDTTKETDIQKATKKGPPYIDPRYKTRSYIEGRMVEAMNACHKLKASDRASIFWVVQHLHETRRTHQQNQKEGRYL